MKSGDQMFMCSYIRSQTIKKNNVGMLVERKRQYTYAETAAIVTKYEYLFFYLLAHVSKEMAHGTWLPAFFFLGPTPRAVFWKVEKRCQSQFIWKVEKRCQSQLSYEVIFPTFTSKS